MADKKIVKIDGLGEAEQVREATAEKPGVFSVSQKALEKFYEDNTNISNAHETFKELEAGRTKFCEVGTKFLAEQAKKTGLDVELRAGSGNGRHILAIDVAKDVRNIQTGEVTTKYGVVSFQEKYKAPFTEEIEKIQGDLESALKKKLGIK